MGVSAGHQTMLKTRVKYPWDYRVEYFEVATTYPLFECGPLMQYNENWIEADVKDATSSLQAGIRNGMKFWCLASFPNAMSTDQKICGSPLVVVMYPYSNRFNFGGFNAWFSYGTSSDYSFWQKNTLTRLFLESTGSDTIKYGVAQGSQSWQNTNYSISGKRLCAERVFPIFLFGSGLPSNPGYEIRNVSVGTRFYECGFDFNISGNLETHIRFVPCMFENAPYICEMYSGMMIPNTMSGTVTPGPQVADDYESYQLAGGEG